MSQMPLPEGAPLRAGHYRIERLLGSGGFGYVYLAQDAAGARYAVKEAFDRKYVQRGRNGLAVEAISTEPRAAQIHRHQCKRAREEAKLFSGNSLRHPNLVRMLECFDANGTTYLVMAYIDGITLPQARSLPLAAKPAWQFSVLRQIADALHVLHGHGLIHRDLKPDNVLLTESGGHPLPILLDTGAARDYGKADNLHTHIQTDFGAPEIVSNAEARIFGAPSPATDCFALAGIAFLLLSGVKPVGYAQRATMSLHSGIDPLGKPPGMSDAVWRVVQRSLRLKVAERHPSAREFIVELGAALGVDAPLSASGGVPNSPLKHEKGAERTETEAVRAHLKGVVPGAVMHAFPATSSLAAWVAALFATLSICLLLLLLWGLEQGLLGCLGFLAVHLVMASVAAWRGMPAAFALMPIANLRALTPLATGSRR